MPSTRKHAIKGVVQGYTGTQLQDDLKTLASLRSEIVYNDGTGAYYFEDDVTKLIVGKACAAVRNDVDASLKLLFEKLKKLLPDKVVKSVTRGSGPDEKQESVPDLLYKMGPLKKVSRIAEKAAHYAVCDDKNHPRPQLQQVRDILRATMVFPPAAWGDKNDGIGSRMIDTVNEHFKKTVVQVKNRFIHIRYPNFAGLNGVKLPQDLEQFIDETFKQTLWGRDSFYRDLQLLIRIDKDQFDNGQNMDHTILELQLASSKMYSGKTDKTNGASGHDMYKNVRAAMEYCEFIRWHKKHAQNGGIRLPKAANYYSAAIEFDKFIEQSRTMADLYRRNDVAWMSGVLSEAIDDSAWFKANK